MAEGIKLAVPILADLLSPTPAEPYVIPPSVVRGGTYRWRCSRWFDNHLQTGDTIRPGLTVHVAYLPNYHDAHYTAASGGCGFEWTGERWVKVWSAKSVMGVVLVPPVRGTTPHTVARWRRIGLHEVGHILGVLDLPRWGDAYVISADSTMHWLTDSTIVAAFDRAGGLDYPGRKVPLADRYHWHSCIAKGDVMAGGERFTTLSLAAFYPGFVTEARGGLDPDGNERWASCPEFGAMSAVAGDRDPGLVDDWLVPNPPSGDKRKP